MSFVKERLISGKMNRKELEVLLQKEKIHRRYSLYGEWQEDSLVLFHDYVGWKIYDVSDGSRFLWKTAYSEDEACHFFYNFITSFRRETQKKLWPYEKSKNDFPKELWLKYEVFFWLNSVVYEEYIPKDIVAIYFRITKYDFSEKCNIHVVGTKEYSDNNDLWCQEIWYKPCGDNFSFNLQENKDVTLSVISNLLRDYLKSIANSEYDIFKDKIITVGFDGESMVRIQ